MATHDEGDFWGSGGNQNNAKNAKARDDSNPAPSGWSSDRPKSLNSGGAGSDDFWATKGKSKPLHEDKPTSSPATGATDAAFWGKAESKKQRDAGAAALSPDDAKRQRSRRRRKWWLIGVGSVVLLLMLLVALAPMIASVFAPGIIAKEASKGIAGQVRVQSVSLSWFGPQRVEKVRLLEKDGHEIASLSVEAEAGLLGLARGDLDLGTVTLRDVKAAIVKYDDGTTNIQKAFAPKTPPKPETKKSDELKVPDSLNAKLVAKRMQVTFTDLTRPGASVDTPTISLRDASVTAEVGAGKPLTASVESEVVSGSRSGSVSVRVKAEKLIRKDGIVQPTKAGVDAEIKLVGLPLELADTVVTLPPGVSLRRGLGETLDLTLMAKGDLNDAAAQITAAAENLSLQADVKVADGLLHSQAPVRLTLKSPGLAALAPQLQAAMKAQDTATIDVLPDTSLTIDNLSFAIPTGSALNLRGASADITLGTSEVRGTVRLASAAASPSAPNTPGGVPATPAVDPAPRPFRIAPLTATIHAPDLAKGVRLTAATSATLGGQAAGDINIDVTVTDLLDGTGGLRSGLPGSMAGMVSVKKIATSIAQLFLAATNLDLPRDIGPTLDIEARATTRGAASTPGGTPPTDISIAVGSDGLKVNGGLVLSDADLRTTGEGVKVEVANLAAIAGHMMNGAYRVAAAPASAAVPGRPQGLTLTVRDVVVARDAAGGMLLDKASGKVSATTGGLAVMAGPPAIAGAALAVDGMTLNAALALGGRAHLDMSSVLSYGGARFSAGANMDITGMMASTAGKPGLAPWPQWRPVGKVELKDVPSGLASMFLTTAAATPNSLPAAGAAPASVAAAPVDMAKLLRDVLGTAVSITLTTAAPANAPDALDATVAIQSPTTTGTVQASATTTQVQLKKCVAETNVTPQTVSSLVQAFAPSVAGLPRLVGPSRLVIQADPVSLPLKDFQPQLAKAGVVGLKVSLPRRTVVDGLQVANADGTKRDLGRVGVDSLEVAVRAPLGALLGPALPEERSVTATLSGTILAGQDEPMMELSGRLATQMSDGKLAGPLNASAKLGKVNTRLVERLAGKDGMVSGAIGPTLGAEVTATLAPPAGSAGKPFDVMQAATQLELTLNAPRLRTNGPLNAVVAPGGLMLSKPVTLAMDVDPEWANAFLAKDPPAGSPPGTPKAPPDIRLTQPMALTISIPKLTYPMGEAKPASPVYVDAEANITIPEIRMVTSEGQAVRMTQVAFQVTASPAVLGKLGGGTPEIPVELRLEIAEAGVGDDTSSKPMTLRASIAGLVEASGKVDTKTATVTLNGDLPALPSALLDAVTKQDGLLGDALGPVASVKVQVERFPLGDIKGASTGQPPIIAAQAESQRAHADLRGTVRDGVFVSERPLEVTVTEMTDKLANRFIKGLPLVGSLNKTTKDAPARITGSNLTAPLGNDMTKLNGEFRIDPGEAHYGASPAFTAILKGVGQRSAGTIGRRLEPINVHVTEGIARYERWSLPLGEFSVQTEGTVDLVKREIDVTTYVPFSELSESAAGLLNSSISGVLGQVTGTVINAATTVPVRTHGPLDNPTTGIDTKAFAETLKKNLKPGDMLKKGVGDLLKSKVLGR